MASLVGNCGRFSWIHVTGYIAAESTGQLNAKESLDMAIRQNSFRIIDRFCPIVLKMLR